MMYALTRRTPGRVADYYNPFRQMEEMERRFFGRPFDSFFDSFAPAEFGTDITDAGDHFLLEADLPGFSKDNICIDLNGDTLTIKAERNAKKEDTDGTKVIRSERSYGSYTRSFDVSGIDTEGIKGKYEDGVLKLTLPKKQEVLPETRRLTIE